MARSFKKAIALCLAVLGGLAGCTQEATVDIPTITLTAPGWTASRDVTGVDGILDHGFIKDAEPGKSSFVATHLVGADDDAKGLRDERMDRLAQADGEDAVKIDDRTLLGSTAYGFAHHEELDAVNHRESRTWYFTKGHYTYSVTISTWYGTPDMPPEVLDAVNHLAWGQVTMDRERAERAGLLGEE